MKNDIDYTNTFTELNNKIGNIDITHQLEDVYTSIYELNKGD